MGKNLVEIDKNGKKNLVEIDKIYSYFPPYLTLPPVRNDLT